MFDWIQQWRFAIESREVCLGCTLYLGIVKNNFKRVDTGFKAKFGMFQLLLQPSSVENVNILQCPVKIHLIEKTWLTISKLWTINDDTQQIYMYG